MKARISNPGKENTPVACMCYIACKIMAQLLLLPGSRDCELTSIFRYIISRPSHLGVNSMMDRNGEVIIPCCYFEFIQPFRDGAKGLAWAKANLGNEHIVEGYINIKGDFVVIKGKSEF